jgi:hypothetical protein
MPAGETGLQGMNARNPAARRTIAQQHRIALK